MQTYWLQCQSKIKSFKTKYKEAKDHNGITVLLQPRLLPEQGNDVIMEIKYGAGLTYM